MANKLPEDLLFAIVQQVECRATLASLCRTSRRHHTLFTPLLYKYVWINNCEFSVLERVSSLRKASHLKFTESIYLGDGIDIPGDQYEAEVAAMKGLVQNLPNLKRFMYTPLSACLV